MVMLCNTRLLIAFLFSRGFIKLTCWFRKDRRARKEGDSGSYTTSVRTDSFSLQNIQQQRQDVRCFQILHLTNVFVFCGVRHELTAVVGENWLCECVSEMTCGRSTWLPSNHLCRVCMFRSAPQPRRIRSDHCREVFPCEENLLDLPTEDSAGGTVPEKQLPSRKEKTTMAIELGVTNLEIQVMEIFSFL